VDEPSNRRAIDAVAAFRPPRSRAEVSERLSRWGWPSIQMAVAAGASWLVSTWVFGAPVGYAPITAIVAMGLGRERRIGRSIVLVAGLVVGIAVAEIAARLVGTGWWQVGLILGISALIAGVVFDVQLAVTYAAINAVVLFGTPGADGWIPDRAVDAVIGVVVAFVVTYLVVPPRPDAEIAVRMHTVADVAVTALGDAARLLADRDVNDRRIALDGAQHVDTELGRLPGTVDHALDVVRFAPLRWGRRDRVERLAVAAVDLGSVVTTASTIVRLTDRAIVDDVDADPSLAEAIESAAAVLDTLVSAIADGDGDGAALGRAHDAIDRLVESPIDKAVSIALREEVHGLLHDLARFAERHGDFDLAGDDGLAGTESSNVRYGRSAGRGGT
jgi:uncharacterized membrane protein YgaE (UPF0421/DUF939 family)